MQLFQERLGHPAHNWRTPAHDRRAAVRDTVLLRLAGPSASRTATAASSLAEHLRTRLMRDGWLLIGPAPAPVARVAGNSRWQLLLHGPAGSDLPLPVETELRALLPADVSLAIDPDPLEL